jgi:hypothetical protein
MGKEAAFKHNSRIWRQMEILGGQTLADLDFILVNIFSKPSRINLDSSSTSVERRALVGNPSF